MSKIKGIEGEDLACIILEKSSYRILERNFHSRYGEVDIVARKGMVLVFVEVKYRQNLGYGLAEEVVNKQKLEKIYKTAQYYLYEHKKLSGDWRIDLVTIDPKSQDYKLYENVFER